MATIYTHADRNIRRTWILMTFFFIVVIAIGWVFAQIYESPIILIIAVVFSVLMSFYSYWYSDRLVLRISRAREIGKSDNPELYRIAENLAITAGLPMPKLYIIEEPALNAFATGRNPEHAVIAVTRGLLDKLNRSELQGVIAHELSHIGNRDMLISTVAVVLVGFVALLSDWFLRSIFWGGYRSRGSSRGNSQGILLVIAIVLSVLAPIIAALMQLAISRKREFLADASGALLTRYPEGLASALEKIAYDATPLHAANNATAHLYISNPFKGREKHSWLRKLFMTHPPIEERIRALRGGRYK